METVSITNSTPLSILVSVCLSIQLKVFSEGTYTGHFKGSKIVLVVYT
jgi:hypothetical protein